MIHKYITSNKTQAIIFISSRFLGGSYNAIGVIDNSFDFEPIKSEKSKKPEEPAVPVEPAVPAKMTKSQKKVEYYKWVAFKEYKEE